VIKAIKFAIDEANAKAGVGYQCQWRVDTASVLGKASLAHERSYRGRSLFSQRRWMQCIDRHDQYGLQVAGTCWQGNCQKQSNEPFLYHRGTPLLVTQASLLPWLHYFMRTLAPS
jgi:hypothetical protein